MVSVFVGSITTAIFGYMFYCFVKVIDEIKSKIVFVYINNYNNFLSNNKSERIKASNEFRCVAAYMFSKAEVIPKLFKLRLKIVNSAKEMLAISHIILDYDKETNDTDWYYDMINNRMINIDNNLKLAIGSITIEKQND